jgi:MFS family permease
MLAVGAALGGLSAGTWGIYPSFVIDGLTFFLSAVFIYQVKYQRSSSLSGAESSLAASLRQYVDGLRYLTMHVDIFITALLKAAAALSISGVFQVVQVVIAKEIFEIGDGGGISLGWMYMSVGIGTGIGPIIARRFTGDRYEAMRWAIILGYAIAAIGLAITATLQSFPIILIGAFLRGIGVGINWVFSAQLLLQLVPNRVRGRVFSTEFALFSLASAIGSMIGGWALDKSGLEVADILRTLTWSALIPGILWGLWILFGKRTEPLLAEAGID